MGKYYIKSGKNMMVIAASVQKDAIKNCVQRWLKQKKKLGRTIRVSEIGFDIEHSSHDIDMILDANAVRELIKKGKM